MFVRVEKGSTVPVSRQIAEQVPRSVSRAACHLDPGCHRFENWPANWSSTRIQSFGSTSD